MIQTWLDLEERFRRLIPDLKYTRLDEQTGAAGEFWRIAGGDARQAANEFELLSMLAGKLLQQVGRNKAELKEIIVHHDFKICWYRALKKFCRAYEPSRSYLRQKD